MRCSLCRTAIVHRILKEYVVRIVDCLVRYVGDAHEPCGGFIGGGNADDIV